MLRTKTLVFCSLALILLVLVWQAVSAESLESFTRIPAPLDRMDNESASLLMVAGILIGASCLASRMLRKPSLQNGSEPSRSPHDAVRTPGI